MFFQKNRRKREKRGETRRGATSSAPIYGPSWKNLRTKQRTSGIKKAPLISMRTPKIIVSYFRLRVMKLTYRILFVVLFLGLFYLLFFSEWLQISSIVIEGNKNTDKKMILDSIEPYLHKKRFFFFPSNNFFLLPQEGIKKEIINNFRRISQVKIKKEFPNTLAIEVEEKKAVLLFCNEKGCLWVDEKGISYNESSYFEALADSSDVVIVEDNSHSDLKVGEAINDETYVSFANGLWRAFSEKTQIELKSLSTPLPSAREIRAHTKDGWTVYFDVENGLERNLDLLVQVLGDIKEKEGEEQVKCLDYIDLRVSDRAFYKLKDNCQKGEIVPPEEGQQGEESSSNNSNGNNSNNNLADGADARSNKKASDNKNNNNNNNNKNQNQNSNVNQNSNTNQNKDTAREGKSKKKN